MAVNKYKVLEDVHPFRKGDSFTSDWDDTFFYMNGKVLNKSLDTLLRYHAKTERIEDTKKVLE